MPGIFGGVFDSFRGFVDDATSLFDRSDIVNTDSSIPVPVFKPTDVVDTGGSFISDVAEAALLTLGGSGGETKRAATVDPNLGIIGDSTIRSQAARTQAVGSVDADRFSQKWLLIAREHARITKKG